MQSHQDATEQPKQQSDTAAALKWGVTPNNGGSPKVINPETGKPMDWENFYDEETKEKLRQKGINPALKAEMDWHKKESPSGGFWGKVAQTAMGGGWIK